MEDRHVRQRAGRVESFDQRRRGEPVPAGILRGEPDADTGGVGELHVGLDVALGGFAAMDVQVASKAGHDHLTFRIHRSARCIRGPVVPATDRASTAVQESAYSASRRCNSDSVGRIAFSITSSIRSADAIVFGTGEYAPYRRYSVPVAVEGTLVILGERDRHRVTSVAEHEQRHFGAVQCFLDYTGAAGFAERLA